MEFHVSILLFLGAFAAGLLGPMIGLGGGFILVPMFALFFKLPFHEAVGTSLICIVATSQAFAISKRSSANTDLKLGIFLEIFTICGVIAGGLIATSLNEKILVLIFACVLTVIFSLMLRRLIKGSSADELIEGSEDLCFSKAQNYAGAGGSLAGGLMAGMLGVGGGVIKVFVLRHVMCVPFKRAAATSNFMIGITVSAGASFYLFKGLVNIGSAAPAVIGAALGAFLAGSFVHRIKSRVLEGIFLIILAYFAFRMFLDFFTLTG